MYNKIISYMNLDPISVKQNVDENIELFQRTSVKSFPVGKPRWNFAYICCVSIVCVYIKLISISNE